MEIKCDCPNCRRQYLQDDIRAHLARFEGQIATEECQREMAEVVELVKATHVARWMREDGVPLQ
jgi:hypothetical protein